VTASSLRRSAPGGSRDGPALVVDGLTKRFGDRVAFRDVSFEVGYGEVFGFLGPNGAGKTTTVRTLGTLIAPTSGSATITDLPLTPDNEVQIRQRIAIMPEAPGLYLRLSVTENLECFAGLYELPAVEGWRQDATGDYVIAIADLNGAAPAITRALVGAGADVLSIGESRHSLQEVYLELIDEDVELNASRA
jgi:ABC-type multidrug transport system ATPase subunit